jgi:NAD(P)H-hydrate repair Nnr-like enzyme with NAD(P)H-hydrate dehydratase domain
MFGRGEVLNFASRADVVLTPHPKEFASLLNVAGLGKFEISEIVRRKFELARLFSQNFPATLVLKGANTIIARAGTLYVCPLGSNKLAVGGSGDVLAGIILAYLAQGFAPLSSAINGVIAHAKTAANYGGAAFSFTPKDMIGGLKWL